MHIFACPNLFWSLLHRIAWKAQIATRYSPPQSISTFTIPTGCQNDQHSKPNISGWSPKNIWCGSKYKNFESSVRHTLECESILYRAPCSRSEISEKWLAGPFFDTGKKSKKCWFAAIRALEAKQNGPCKNAQHLLLLSKMRYCAEPEILSFFQ